jgi:hypothetical protein
VKTSEYDHWYTEGVADAKRGVGCSPTKPPHLSPAGRHGYLDGFASWTANKPAAIVDQPPPIPTTRQPAWEIVMSYVEQEYGATDIFRLVLADMRERDVIGRQRYGTALTAANGRDHLVDATQELLDACAYLAAALDEHGVSPAEVVDADRIPDPKLRWHLFHVQQIFVSQVRTLIQLRSLIEERHAS